MKEKKSFFYKSYTDIFSLKVEKQSRALCEPAPGPCGLDLRSINDGTIWKNRKIMALVPSEGRGKPTP